MADQQQNKSVNKQDNTPKPSINKKDVVVVTVWGWPKRAAKRLLLQIKRHRVGLIFAVIIFVLVGSLIVLGYFILQKKQARSAEWAKKTSQEEINNEINTATLRDADGNEVKGSYERTVNSNMEFLEKATTRAEKAKVYNIMASVALAANVPDDAVKYAQLSNKEAESADAWSIIATVEESKSNYKEAENAYGKASQLSPKTEPNARSNYNDYRLKQIGRAHV